MDAELVVNLHVTEQCNYSCSFCFGKWGLPATAGVFQDPNHSIALVSDLFNVLSGSEWGSRGIRFNFAGGEPALLHALPELVEHCRGLGARTSFVSNGLMLRRFDALWLSQNFDIVGLSVDSASELTNLRIGRVTRSGRAFNLAEITSAVRELRSISRCPIKINTVVCRTNVREDLSPVLRSLAPDKWKVFQALPIYEGAETITAADFSKFLRRHIEFTRILVSEDNNQMTTSYLMVDPLGRFFWPFETGSRRTGGYSYSRPILEAGAAASFQECKISWAKYKDRYHGL
ncbi:viperin family antiviral radical SAM protein [Streptomyces sp. NBC_01236]|uniref:viperin family antiviral radical SAM protein n=1 Tax=Streptomyces sp. NBC_01236 TaxID=2903789 RepID=UPI002E1062A1|nr:viperin family antiviral radical SAM protein [Streptomyces sp. NBC_01236]